MCDYGWDGYNVGIELRKEREERRRAMAEKRENPIKQKSQEPDEQNKTTTERVDKQDVTKEKTGETGAGDFITGTTSPDKEG